MPTSLFDLLYRRPDLVLEHGQLYAQLIRHEAASTGKHWVRRIALMVCGGVMLLIALTLAGVSVTLGLTTLAPWSWALFAAPLGVLALAVVCLMFSQVNRRSPIATLSQQFQQDWDLLKALLARQA